MKDLELLAPARNADIGIAAIDCGADAVYMAGPRFGARQAAGNGIEDMAKLCGYAHRYGARVFATVNTIVYDNEREEFARQLAGLRDAGVDAFIVQDFSAVGFCDGGIPLHASTQCAIRTPEKARALASMGFSRLILERELSLTEIRKIAEAVPECEIECFVHGALCVCYSGQCYLSEMISGRSANRGACIQACRSRYDLCDRNGKILLKDKSVLSLKDLNLSGRLEELAEAGVCSFKIEGRLKNESYVRNVVRKYSLLLDELVAKHPGEYRRTSFGRVTGAFTPALDKTFNRGYTELFIDGEKRSGTAAMDAAKGMGERIGKVISVRRNPQRGSASIEVECPAGVVLNNGDGFSMVAGNGEVIGFRGDVCSKSGPRSAVIHCKNNGSLYKGAVIFRNIDSAFEKEIAAAPGHRLIDADVEVNIAGGVLRALAVSEDGRPVSVSRDVSELPEATNRERVNELLHSQLGKNSEHFNFSVKECQLEQYPLLSAAFINGIRRELASGLAELPCLARPMKKRSLKPSAKPFTGGADYRLNIANATAAEFAGINGETAYELSHDKNAELMRSRYCIRRELGICPKINKSCTAEPLYLLNNGRRLKAIFDCSRCEMVIKEE